MPAETKYIARRSGPFAALMQAAELAGFRLDPLPPGSLRDAYFDTAAGDLLRQGYALRVREQGRTALAQLRVLRGEAAGAPGEADAALAPPVAGPTLPLLPDGPLRDAVDWLAGEAPLRALLRLRQYRSARVAYDGPRLVGILSLDVVGYELPAGLHVANEVEVELAETGAEADLHRLDPVLRARGLEPTSRSKFERGVLRLQRGPDDPLLLLPDERAALDALLEASDPAVRRRARVVLLASRGYRDETVSAKAGLSPSRVRHWVQRFREGRLDALGAPESPLEALGASGEGPDRDAAASARRRPFRISEVVTGGTPTPALFRAEHFAPEPSGEASPEASFVVEREREEPPAPPLAAHGDGSAGGPPPEPFALVRGLPDEEPAPEAAPAPALDPAPPDVPDAGPVEPEPIPEDHAAPSAEAAPGPDQGAGAHAGEPPLPDDVETLDDLLNLFETSPVRTPRLSGPQPAAEHAPEPASPDEAASPDEPERAPAFVWLEAPPEAEAVQGPEGEGAEGTEHPVEAPAPADVEPEPSPERAPAPPIRPRFRPADPILHAGARVLRYQHARFAESAARVGEAAAPADVRRALLAAHRVRLALETFEEFLPAQPVRRLHAGLAGVVRALDAVADLDAVAAHLDAARSGAPAADRPALDRATEALAARREAARLRVTHRLIGAVHVQWTRRLERLLALLDAQAEAGLLEGDFFPLPPDDYVGDPAARPQRVRLRHMLGSSIWRRYEALRAYERVVDEAGDDLLRPLGVGCAGLQFVLGLAAEAAPAEVREAARALEGAEAHLATLHRARVTADLLADLAAELPHPGPVARLSEGERQAQAQALVSVRDVWRTLTSDELRRHLAGIAAAL